MSAGNWRPTGWWTPVTQVLSGGKVVHHHHDGAYAAIVLDGRYVERGDAGLMIARPATSLSTCLSTTTGTISIAAARGSATCP